MTIEEREEAIAYIKVYRKLDEDLHNTSLKDSISYYATDKCLKYWNMAIKALEREHVLDKIRAEIANLDDADYDYEGYYKAVTDAIAIIDKYKRESEDKG